MNQTSRMLVAVVLLVVVVAGCGPEDDKKAKTAKTKVWIIGMSQCNLNEPWRKQMNKDIAAAAAKHDNVRMMFKDAQNNVTVQQDQVREFILQKIDLLIISPKESKPLVAPVAQAMKAGIPVIVLDRAVEGEDWTCFIGGDNRVIGKAVGQYVASLLPDGGKLVEIEGLRTSKPGVDRHEGFIEGLGDKAGKGEGKIEIIYSSDCQWLEEKAVNDMQSVLSRFDKIDVVYGHNDPMAHGAWVAAKDKKREKAIKFIGIDALPHEGMQYVRQGVLNATFYYPTLGPEAIDAALKILRGEKVEKRITLGTKIFTKDNVDTGGKVVNP